MHCLFNWYISVSQTIHFPFHIGFQDSSYPSSIVIWMVRMFNNWETDTVIYCFKPSMVHWFNSNFNANLHVNILTVKLITIYPHLKDGPHSNIKVINFFENGKKRALELILIISSKLYAPTLQVNTKFL